MEKALLTPFIILSVLEDHDKKLPIKYIFLMVNNNNNHHYYHLNNNPYLHRILFLGKYLTAINKGPVYILT